MNAPSQKGRLQRKMNAFATGNLIRLMLEGTYTCAELAEETGLHYITVLHYARELHRAKAAHISGWEKDSRGRDALRIYKIGIGRDAKRSKLSANERQARQREKRKMAEMAQVQAGKGRYVPSANGRLRFEVVT